MNASMRCALICAVLAFLPSAAAQTPIITGVRNMASQMLVIAPGSPLVVYGSNLAPSFAECVAATVPLICNGASATVNGRAAPVRTAGPVQVIIYIPVELPAGPATVVVRNQQVASAPYSFILDAYGPGLHQLGDQRGSTGFFSDDTKKTISRDNPAVPGQAVTAYAVGLGPTNPVVPTGTSGNAPTTTLPALFIAGRQVPVTSSALGCGLICEPAVYLVRFTLPTDVARGELPLYIEIGGKRSNTVVLPVGTQQTPAAPVIGYLQSLYPSTSTAMSPGMLAWLGGGGFRADQGSPICGKDPAVWPPTCQGVTVLINGRAAALQAVTPTSIALQVPLELALGPATVIVERNTGTQVLRSAPFNITLDPVSPAIAVQTALPPYAAVTIASSGNAATPSNPLLAGDMIFIQAIGLGQTRLPLVTGFSPPAPTQTLLPPTLTIGGRPCDSVVGEIFPDSVGTYRITAVVPKGLPSGDLPIVIEIGGRKSQDGLMVPVSTQPVIAAVTNAASSLPGVVSGSWVTIYGRNLTSAARVWTEEDIIYDWLPTSLDNVFVAFNDILAVTSFVSPTQLNVLAPDNLPPGPVDITVQSSQGWQKTRSTVRPYSPGFFTLQVGPGTYLVALHSDWSYLARPNQLPPSLPSRPAKPGEVIVLYGTGFGATQPAVSSRQRFTGVAPLANPSALTVQISGRPAQIVFSGLVGNGLYQVNVVVPDLPDGDHEVVAVMGGEASARGRLIPVQR